VKIMKNDVNEILPPSAEAWLDHHVEGYHGPGRLSKFAFGQSNPTFRLESRNGKVFVLRRKPLGLLLPKAHAVEREYRVLAALAGTEVPVPRVFALCEEPGVFDTSFYVMEMVQGRIFYDQRLPGLTRTERADIFDAMNRAVAQLHAVIPSQVGLTGYGKEDGFLPRQVTLWTKQYRAAEADRIEAMENLIAWLPQNLPPETDTRIFHGDLRLDNMVFHPTESKVIALLDWELSTLGDPLADFAYHAVVWRIPVDLFRGFSGLNFPALGIPSERDYLLRYCQRTGRSEPRHWNFYLAFCLFRLAAILQGVWQRSRQGNASSADAADMGSRARPLAELGWQIALEDDHPT
jgi:aminoglycoside phosphotransferase (APT) family kinase protein